MKDYNVEDRLITKEDWENWLKLRKEYSGKRLPNMSEAPIKKETKYAVIEWHQYSQEKPTKENEYLVSITDGNTRFSTTDYWSSKNKVFKYYTDASIIAWAELPESYKGES